MSTVVQPQPRVKVRGKAEARVDLWDLVRAELTRSRRTFTWGVIGATSSSPLTPSSWRTPRSPRAWSGSSSGTAMLWRGCICMPGPSRCLWGC